MARPALEIADIFRDYGPAWRKANAGHVSLGQLKVMSAIESCRTVALGGHVMRCENCLHTQIAYNSCRNRHAQVPGLAGAGVDEAAQVRTAGRPLLSRRIHAAGTDCRHRLPEQGHRLRSLVQGFSQTMRTIAADPNRLGVKIGFTSVLHTWGSAMTHHPHVHMVVPGGGISLDGTRWISCRPNFSCR